MNFELTNIISVVKNWCEMIVLKLSGIQIDVLYVDPCKCAANSQECFFCLDCEELATH